MDRFICIHCRFYQPPRETPWLEAIESQDSASPYHDWNERITAECYRPNGAAGIRSPPKPNCRLGMVGSIIFAAWEVAWELRSPRISPNCSVHSTKRQ